ncbi:hypothetical protein TNIN_447421 [Trichonephila inaurata madagascariensis]|uniref:RING-type domain-containing protein n=1 Tax=Trichonephila inaurata madagascariensis TaxID=2747483 RepID=A0A8X6XSH5_9ARAC|nr:hypothetical protein TNIN_447421 [Trichonephila inaurata madagascariensis]
MRILFCCWDDNYFDTYACGLKRKILGSGRRLATELSEPIASTSTAHVNEKVQNKTKTSEATCSTGITVECGICLETTDEVTSSGKMLMSTTCGHIFCNDCMESIFKESRSKCCPNCRKRITRRQVHPIFL